MTTLIDTLIIDAKRGLIYADLLSQLHAHVQALPIRGAVCLTNLVWEVATCAETRDGVHNLHNHQIKDTVKWLEELRKLV